MQMPQIITPAEMVLEGFKKSRDMLASVLGGYGEMESFTKVLGALRMMDDEMLESVGRPVILGMFELIGADPKTVEGRNKMMPYMDNLALALQDSVSIIMAQAQHQTAKEKAFASGRLIT